MPIYRRSVSRYGLKDRENRLQITGRECPMFKDSEILQDQTHLNWKNLLVLKLNRFVILVLPTKALK